MMEVLETEADYVKSLRECIEVCECETVSVHMYHVMWEYCKILECDLMWVCGQG